MRIYRYSKSESVDGYACEDRAGNFREGVGNVWEGLGLGTDLQGARPWLAPIVPSVVIGIALNYRAHAAETGKAVPERPVFFLKLPNAVQAHGAPIPLPRHAPSQQVDYEGELAVVLSRPCRNVSVEEAMSYVLGYTCANDLSARDWQFQWGGGQFCRAKSFDGFCPLGPCLVTADEIPDPGRLRLRTWVNGDLRQDTSTSDLVFGVPELISFLSQDTTLPAGTVILTGTPSGVGHGRIPKVYLQAGDEVAVEIEGIGRLVNRMV